MTDDLVDVGGLRTYLDSHHPEMAGDFEVTRIGEGQSCLTFLVTGTDWEVILRRPPRGKLPPSAFDVRREFRVMHALSGSDTGVPVPKTLSLCEDQDVIGANFYLMNKVDGEVIRQVIPPYLDDETERRRMSEQLVDSLVKLHGVDFNAVGLNGFGKPAGYLERQLQRMTQLWGLAKFREISEIEQVGSWLFDNLPSNEDQSIVHGDYKLDNVIMGPEAPAEIVAIVDWEMSTLGHPLADVGWMLYFWRDPGDSDFGLATTTVTHMEGFLRRADILQRYADATGRSVENILWYVALAGWKIAIIMEGSYKRFKEGITDHPMFDVLEQGVIALAQRSHHAMTGEFEI